MIQYCCQQYLQLKEDLENCRSKELCSTAEIECCYSIAENYWFRIKSTMKQYAFKSKKEEIIFFKEVKPKFLAEKEFYSLLYHAALFMPVDIVAEMDFWLRESQRLEKFIKENQEFYNYYKSGNTAMDGILFSCEDIEAEGLHSGSHSQLIAIILSLERYDNYVKQRLPNAGGQI